MKKIHDSLQCVISKLFIVILFTCSCIFDVRGVRENADSLI